MSNVRVRATLPDGNVREWTTTDEGQHVPVTLRSEFWSLVQAEVDRAYAKHGADRWGRHEFFAILLEEVDEVKEAVWRDLPAEELQKEIIQVAAMCLRYFETGNRYRDNPREL